MINLLYSVTDQDAKHYNIKKLKLNFVQHWGGGGLYWKP
jgi:hypothetical protein